MIHSERTKITIAGSLAYAAQKPWIMSGTLKDNIVFTLPYDDNKFKNAIHYSSLDHDLSILPKK
jgi:ABC-type multidrug transport system fused ATPase/permease subunit